MSMLFKFEGGQAQMFTMLFSNFPETIKKEVKDICINCSQNLILEENAWENIQPLLDSCSIDCFLFWLDENYPATNRIISRIRQKKKYQHTPMLFFSFKIEYLLSAFVLWKSCEREKRGTGCSNPALWRNVPKNSYWFNVPLQYQYIKGDFQHTLQRYPFCGKHYEKIRTAYQNRNASAARTALPGAGTAACQLFRADAPLLYRQYEKYCHDW